MKQTITKQDFVDAFHQAGREDNFSDEALEMMFDYFEDMDPDMELDVIAVCCEYTEQSIPDFATENNISEDEVMDYLNDYTLVFGTTSDGNVVFQCF